MPSGSKCGYTDHRLAYYLVYTSSRSAGQSRAMICVREGLPSLKLGASTSNILDIDVKIGSVSISVICVHFQPSTNVSLSALMRILCICKGTVIICGDFNAHNVMWGSNHCDGRENILRKAIDKSGLCLLNDDSVTFFLGYNYSSCLDLIRYVWDFASGIEWRTNAETRGSDHSPILIRHRRLRSSPPWRSTKMTNWQAFRFHMTHKQTQ